MLCDLSGKWIHYSFCLTKIIYFNGVTKNPAKSRQIKEIKPAKLIELEDGLKVSFLMF